MNADQYEKEAAFMQARITELDFDVAKHKRDAADLLRALSASEVDVIRGKAALAACEAELIIVRERCNGGEDAQRELASLREQRLQSQRLWQELRSRMNAHLDPGEYSGAKAQQTICQAQSKPHYPPGARVL